MSVKLVNIKLKKNITTNDICTVTPTLMSVCTNMNAKLVITKLKEKKTFIAMLTFIINLRKYVSQILIENFEYRNLP